MAWETAQLTVYPHRCFPSCLSRRNVMGKVVKVRLTSRAALLETL